MEVLILILKFYRVSWMFDFDLFITESDDFTEQ